MAMPIIINVIVAVCNHVTGCSLGLLGITGHIHKVGGGAVHISLGLCRVTAHTLWASSSRNYAHSLSKLQSKSRLPLKQTQGQRLPLDKCSVDTVDGIQGALALLSLPSRG